MPLLIEFPPASDFKVLNYVTVFDYPSTPVPTVNGLLTYDSWLEREAVRVSKVANCTIVRNKAGDQIALAIIR